MSADSKSFTVGDFVLLNDNSVAMVNRTVSDGGINDFVRADGSDASDLPVLEVLSKDSAEYYRVTNENWDVILTLAMRDIRRLRTAKDVVLKVAEYIADHGEEDARYFSPKRHVRIDVWSLMRQLCEVAKMDKEEVNDHLDARDRE